MEERRVVEMLASSRWQAASIELRQQRACCPPVQSTRLRAVAAVPSAWIWIASAFSVAAALAAGVLVVFGANPRAIVGALRVTARFSFVLFWFSYASGALATLFGPAFKGLARRRREFGLAFASAHVVHLGLVAWLYQIATKKPIPDSSVALFSLGFFWIFFLVLLSMDRIRQNMPGIAWRILQTVGLEYVAFLFFFDFFQPRANQPLAYFPFATTIMLGFALRIAALLKRVRS
jgi:hypothetical protein